MMRVTKSLIILQRVSAFALIAAVPVAAFAQTAPAPAAPQAAPAPAVTPAPSPLAQIPGVTIEYYDVTGATIKDIRASMDAQRPKDPTTGQTIPASASWQIGTNLKRQTVGDACKIIGATASLKAEVVLPRLVNTETVPEPVLKHWQTYVTGLEQQQANILRQPYQRLSEVEQAVMASSCEGAKDAANKAITEITKAPPPPVVATPVE